jgi:nucleotide-binding universal stress UspA family protein
MQVKPIREEPAVAESSPFRNVLVGVDGTPTGRDAIALAARAFVQSLDGVEGRVALGTPASELLAFGDELDLLVVGSRGHGPLRRLILGSTSLELTREARCPLLIMPRPATAEHMPNAD